VEEYIETLNGYFRYRKPVWLVPQAFGGNEWWTREPDPREVRAMTYLGLIHHASGVQYFIRKGLNGSPKSQAVWGECGAMAQELMELLPSLAYGQPAPPAVSSNKEVQARTINRNGVFTILVVNTSNEPKEFSLQLEGIDLVMEVEVLFEGRKVFMQNGMFTDMIDAYGTRLYRVDGEMRPDWRKDFKAGNLVVDPGFEDIANAGIPAACYVDPGKDRGATFFLDARVHKQGLHSIRLITPRAEAGAKLRFFGLELDPDKSYTCSVWAKKAASDPNLKPEDMDFTMSLGVDQTAQFLLNDTWTEYSFTTAGVPVKPSLHRWSMPGLELNSAGTAWFDMLQVVPDLEIMHRAKGIGQDGIEKQGQGSMEVELRSSQADALIYYTIDGTEPSLSSKMYQEPFLLTESATVRAAAFKEGTLVGSIQKAFTVHKATGASVKYEILYEQYEGGGHTGLVDGILASANYKDGRWQGFHGQDAIFSIDLGDIQQISEVSMHFLQDITVWIFLPREVRVSVSTDGITFTPLATISHEVPLEKRGAMIHEFQAQFSPVQARYIRVEAGSIQLCPSWHSGAGQPAWIFLDEVILN
jgi:hypothetical protein